MASIGAPGQSLGWLGILESGRRFAISAGTVGSRAPITISSSLAHPDTHRRSVTTLGNLPPMCRGIPLSAGSPVSALAQWCFPQRQGRATDKSDQTGQVNLHRAVSNEAPFPRVVLGNGLCAGQILGATRIGHQARKRSAIYSVVPWTSMFSGHLHHDQPFNLVDEVLDYDQDLVGHFAQQGAKCT